MRAREYIRVLTRLALVSCLTSCSLTEKQARLSPLTAAEHRLARAEKIRSDPSERAKYPMLRWLPRMDSNHDKVIQSHFARGSEAAQREEGRLKLRSESSR